MVEQAIFGAGCFWGVEERFRTMAGVKNTEVGYCGGELPDPTYKEVCTDTTGHAEVVKIDFDPSIISFGDLLEIFWSSHNPTTLNRQGPDFGSQYRSVIFYTTEEQKEQAEEAIKRLENEGRFKDPIVTQVVKEFNYFKAEEYHQKYLFKKGATTCGI